MAFLCCGQPAPPSHLLPAGRERATSFDDAEADASPASRRHDVKVDEQGLASTKEPATGQNFTVVLQCAASEPIGLIVDRADKTLLEVVGIPSRESSAAARYNRQAEADMRLLSGDLIMAVNSVAGDGRLMEEALSSNPRLVLKVCRPMEFEVRLLRRGASGEERLLGIDIHRSDRGSCLIISALRDGLLQAWNERSASRRVRRLDRIVAVNGMRGHSSGLLRALKSEGPTLSLTIAQPDWSLVQHWLEAK